ncbi:MAG: hypothetical protein ACKO1L_05700 [Brachymonas sp.]
MPVTIPKIGDMITTEQAIELCRHYDLHYLIERISKNPQDFKSWVFDGASMIQDALFAKIFSIPNLTVIALRYDLKYAYGDPENQDERKRADKELKQELLNDQASKLVVYPMYWAVRVFGNGPLKTDFTWGFARNNT